MDRRIDSRIALHLPTDVDLEAGIRRIRTLHRPQEVLLSACVLHRIIIIPQIPEILRERERGKEREREKRERGASVSFRRRT